MVTKPRASAVLLAAQELIRNSEWWTRRYLAATASGESVDVRDPAATRFSAQGALLLAGYKMYPQHPDNSSWNGPLSNAARDLFGSDIRSVNDGRRPLCHVDAYCHRRVMDCYDSAVALMLYQEN